MEKIIRLLEDLPLFAGLDKWTRNYMAGLAERKEYAPNEWLFHESTPRTNLFCGFNCRTIAKQEN